jgi:hypothetical protein
MSATADFKNVELLNRSPGWLQESVKSFPDDCVTLTGCSLQALPIKNLNGASPIADKTGCLHGLRSKRYRFAIGAEYIRQKLVGICKGIALSSVVHHEKPPAHSLFRRMHRIAGYGLLNLGQQSLRIAHEEIARMFAGFEFFL